MVICFCSNINAYALEENADSNEVDTKRYYYNQLTDLEKGIYNNFILYEKNFTHNQKIEFCIYENKQNQEIELRDYANAVVRARKAYSFDNPEAQIWYQTSKTYVFKEEERVYVYLKPKDETKRYADISTENMEEALKEVKEKASQFVETLEGTDKEKLKQIYDWLTQNVTYDKTTILPNTANPYGAIIEGRAICVGYASAYKYIADLAGLKVLYVTGNVWQEKTKSYQLHAWNIAQLENEWVLVDATLGSNLEDNTNYLFAPIHNGIHYIDNSSFKYP